MKLARLLLMCPTALVATIAFAACGGGGPNIQATQTATAEEEAAASATAAADAAHATATAEARSAEVTATAEARAIDATATTEAFEPFATATAEAQSVAATATAEAERQASIGQSRDNPVPFGQPYTVPEGWEVTVLDFISDATAAVLQDNQFNDPPQPGKRFVMVRLRGTNVSADEPADFDATFAFRLVGSLNVSYSTFENSCGVIPGRFENTEAFRGGTVEGNICFEVGATETDFVLFTEFFLTFDEEGRRWLDVQ